MSGTYTWGHSQPYCIYMGLILDSYGAKYIWCSIMVYMWLSCFREQIVILYSPFYNKYLKWQPNSQRHVNTVQKSALLHINHSWTSNSHSSVTVENQAHVYITFVIRNDLRNIHLKHWHNVLKYPVYVYIRTIFQNLLLTWSFKNPIKHNFNLEFNFFFIIIVQYAPKYTVLKWKDEREFQYCIFLRILYFPTHYM
jgi:hypothetical protein